MFCNALSGRSIFVPSLFLRSGSAKFSRVQWKSIWIRTYWGNIKRCDCFGKKNTSNFTSVLYAITHVDFPVEIQHFEVNYQYSPMVQIESLLLPFCLTAQTGMVQIQQQGHQFTTVLKCISVQHVVQASH